VYEDERDGERLWESNADEVGLAYVTAPGWEALGLAGTLKPLTRSRSAVSSSTDVSADEAGRGTVRSRGLAALDRVKRRGGALVEL
jgi:hypothetical protein